MSDEPYVYVVDDDEDARKSVCALVLSMGAACRAFASAEEFLTWVRAQPQPPAGCVVTDLRMPGMSGLELQEAMLAAAIDLPLIVLTAYARTPTTVRAIRAGAVTVLDKPYADDDLWDAVRAALARNAADRAERVRQRQIVERLAQLTADERKVLDGILAGRPNKQIAQELDVSLRTVENRRRDLFQKMQAESAAELIRMVVESGYRQKAT